MEFDPKTGRVVKRAEVKKDKSNAAPTVNFLTPQMLSSGNFCVINVPNSGNTSSQSGSQPQMCVLQPGSNLPIIDPSVLFPVNVEFNQLQAEAKDVETEINALVARIQERDYVIQQLVDRVNSGGKGRKRTRERGDIETYLAQHRSYVREQMEGGGYRLVCRICESRPRNAIRRGLAKGLVVKPARAKLLADPGHVQWRCMKRQLNRHLEKHEAAEADVDAMRCQLSICLQLIKMKVSNKYYPHLLSLGRLFADTVGDRGHNANRVGPMLAGLKSYAAARVRAYLAEHPGSHVALSIGRCTVYKSSYYAVMAVLGVAGRRVSVPVDCRIIQTVSGGRNRELLALVSSVLREGLQTAASRLTAVHADIPLPDTFHDDLRTELRLPAASAAYFLAVRSPPHWVEGVMRAAWDAVPFFKSVVKRVESAASACSSSGVASVAKLLDCPRDQDSTSSGIQMCNTVLEFLSENLESFTTLADRALSRPFKELLVAGAGDWPGTVGAVDTGLWLDLCALVDVLAPLRELVLALQQQQQQAGPGHSAASSPAWLLLNYCPRVVSWLDMLQSDLIAWIGEDAKTAPEPGLFPVLAGKLDDIVQYREMNLRLAAMAPASASGDLPPIADFNIRARVRDYLDLCGCIKQTVQSGLDSYASPALVDIKQCFDAETMLKDLASLSDIPEWQKKIRLERYYKRGLGEFLDFYSYLMTLPHLKDEMDPDAGSKIFKQWKDLFYDLILKSEESSTRDFFYDCNGEYLRLKSRIKKITLKTESITQLFYDLTLDNDEILSNIQFHEQNFFKYVTGSPKVAESQSLLKEFHHVLDYVFSTFCTDNSLEVFFGLMRSHEKDGRSGDHLSSRAIVDFVYPHPLQCGATMAKLARKFLVGDDQLGICAQLKPTFASQKSKEKFSIGKCLDNILADELPRVPLVLCDKDAGSDRDKLKRILVTKKAVAKYEERGTLNVDSSTDDEKDDDDDL